MRVLLFDPLNTQNNFYVLAKYLRRAGVSASLLIDLGNWIPEEHSPRWHENKNLGFVYRLDFSQLVRNPAGFLKVWSEMKRLADGFDLIVCSGLAPILAARMRKPFLFISQGSDLDQEAVQGWSGIPRNHFTIANRLEFLLRKNLIVWSIRRARATVLSPYQIPLAERLGLKNLRSMPHIIDPDVLKPMPEEQRCVERGKLRKDLDCDLVLFHPSRQVWLDPSLADCKGNDKVFIAFARFVSHHKRAKLIVVNKGWDADKSRQLVNELGIRDNVVWLNPMVKLDMDWYYNTADIVLDQFTVGVLALVAVEAMACGTPVISYVTKACYDERPPVVSAHSTYDIYANLVELAGNTARREMIGERGVDWVRRSCHPGVAIKKYISLFHEVVA